MTAPYNSDFIHELEAIYLKRNDALNRWGNLTASYLALPGLRFFAPMSVVGASGQARDLALGNDLGANNNPLFFFDNLAPYCFYNGSNKYHSIADNAAHDIIGNEPYMPQPGLTMGMWVMPLAVPAAAGRILSKGTTTGNARAYSLLAQTTSLFTFTVSDNGTNAPSVSSADAFSINNWYFVAGRFTPSTELKLWEGSPAGLSPFINTTSIPATINNSATGLAVGAQADGTQFSHINASMCFICAGALDDFFIFSLFEQGRKLFGG